MREWLLGVTVEIWAVFRQEFARLWRTERNGMLYARSLFEDRGDALGAEQALDGFIAELWTICLASPAWKSIAAFWA
jgi:5-methylthioribose kinase